MYNPDANQGFTLLEIMTVVAIVAFMGIMATPILLSQLPTYRLKETARIIASTLHYAKMSAAASGKEYRVKFFLDTFPQRYQLQRGNFFSGSGSWFALRTFQELPPQVIIDHATDYRGTHHFGSSTLVFNPTGTSSSGGIYLKNSKGEQYSVKISSSTGRIRIEAGW